MTDVKVYSEALDTLRRGVGSKRTICEVHRCLYDEIETLSDAGMRDRMTALLEEAYLLGKVMGKKLEQHKLKLPDSWYEREKPTIIVARQELRAKRVDT